MKTCRLQLAFTGGIIMEILLLGTIHLEETTDYIQLSDETKGKLVDEQFEILTNDLATFQPNQIFVEYPFSLQVNLDTLYQNYLKTNSLFKNEIYQIGFRLAKRLQHEKIYAVDWNEAIPGLKELDAISDEHSVYEFQQILTRASEQMKTISSKLNAGNIIELFKFINSPKQTRLDHQTYSDLMILNDEIAFEWVANYWYYRNLKIVQNIRKSIEQGTQRALILYGAGHNYLLQQLLEDIPEITVIPYSDYTSNHQNPML